MKSQLTYLLEELDKWPPNKSIRVIDLKWMIENSFKQAWKDKE